MDDFLLGLLLLYILIAALRILSLAQESGAMRSR